MRNTFTDFATITNPALVLKSLLFAAAQVWGIDEDEIGREIDKANVTVWAPIACRALGIAVGSWNALNQNSVAMRELCETANAIVAVLVGLHPDAFSWRFEKLLNESVLGFDARLFDARMAA